MNPSNCNDCRLTQINGETDYCGGIEVADGNAKFVTRLLKKFDKFFAKYWYELPLYRYWRIPVLFTMLSWRFVDFSRACKWTMAGI